MIMRALQEQGSTMITSESTKSSIANPEQRRGLPTVRSGTNLLANVDSTSSTRVKEKENQIKKELDPVKGFDLS